MFDSEQNPIETPAPALEPDVNLDDLVYQIVNAHRLRRTFHKAEKSLTLQIYSVCRRLCEALPEIAAIEDWKKRKPALRKAAENLYQVVDKTYRQNLRLRVRHDRKIEKYKIALFLYEEKQAKTQRVLKKPVEPELPKPLLILGEDYAVYEWVGDHPYRTDAIKITKSLLDAREMVRFDRDNYENKLETAAQQLPVWPWAEKINGIGAVMLGQLVAEAGRDLRLYPTHSHLWKRLGLGLVGDERQRCYKDVKKAELHGYSPERRSVTFVLSDGLMKKTGFYRDLYDGRKAYEIERGLKKGHAHNRALRYVAKRFTRDLWREWNRCS